jgi:outer membrane protein assembly factor BamB
VRRPGLFALVLIAAAACAARSDTSAQSPHRLPELPSPAVSAQAFPMPAGAHASASPPPWSGPPQTTPPLPVVRDAPVPISGAPAARTDGVLPLSLAGAKLVASGGHMLYFASGSDAIEAVDARTARVRWRAGGVRQEAAASETLLFTNTQPARTKPFASDALALSAEDGHRVVVRPGSWNGAVLHGFYYATLMGANNEIAFTAFDGTTGRELWANRGTAFPGGPPEQIGGTLLQSFSESGAILVNAMHAFDVATGRELWRTGYGPSPLGTAADAVYLDTTWFPMQLDDYVPLGVGTVDLVSGTLRHEFYYKPDPARNWPRRPNAAYGARGAHVAGGFVTFEVDGAWYRYDADRDPNHAHAVRLDGIDDVAAWFDGPLALVEANGGVALGRWLGERIVLRPLGTGTLRAPVATSDGGTRYALVGTQLLAIDRGASRVRALGEIACAQVRELSALTRSVAVRCAAARAGTGDRLIDVADPLAPVAAALPKPHAPAPPRFALSVKQWPVPPGGPTPENRQWWPSSIAPAPGGGLAIVLTPGGQLNRAGAIGRVSPSGEVRLLRFPDTDPPRLPHDVVVDAHGTLWFNDDETSIVTSLRADGALRTVQIGATPEPSPTPRTVVLGGRPVRISAARRMLGIRLAIGPDGEAWYARTHPARTIGRVDGTRAFAVPDALGDVLALTGGRDGALWFLTADAVGRLTLDGRFSRVALPPELSTSYPARRIVPGGKSTVWISSGKRVAEVDAQRVLRTTSLPNASSAIAALTAGCDGALYAADAQGTQLARFAADGSVEEYATGLYSIDGLAVASDCRLWFVGGSNAPDQQVGTFTLTPTRG